MANSEEIFSSEIEQSELFVEALKEIKVAMDHIIPTFDKELAVFKPKTLPDLQKGNNLLKKTTEATETQTKVIKTLSFEEAKLRLQRQESNKQAKQAVILAREEATSLNALQIKLSQMQATYDKLSEAERNNAEVGKLLLGNIQQLDSQVKVLEESTGRHQRSVGNYGKAFGGLGKTVGSVTSLFGIHSEVLNRLELILIKSSNAIQGYEKSTKASKLAQQAGTEATTKATVAQRIYNSIVGKSTGAMKAFRISLAATGIGAIIFLLYEAASAMGFLTSSTEENTAVTEAQNAALEKEKKLLEDIKKFGRAELTTAEVIGKVKKGYNDAEVAVTELEDALNDLIEQEKNYTFEASASQKINNSIASQQKINQLEKKKLLFENNDIVLANIQAEIDAEKKKIDQSNDIFKNSTATTKKEKADLAENIKMLQDEIDKRTQSGNSMGKQTKELKKLNKEREVEITNLQKQIDQEKIIAIKDEQIEKIAQLKFNAKLRIDDINATNADEQKKAELILLINENLYQDILALKQKSLDDLSKEDDDATNQIKESFKKK